MSKRKKPETYTVTADPEKANMIACVLVSAVNAFVDVVNPKPQDILFGMTMALAVQARRMGAVESEVEKMLRVCLQAPLVKIPESRGSA